MPTASSLDERAVLELLAVRHAKDVFVPQCKMGPSGSRVLDAWAMAKSWAHPQTTGYEVKVSRSDFLRDQKWTSYLPFCNSFYFVAPRGIIARDEVPEQAGLLEVAGTGTRLFSRKKAPFRPDVEDAAFRYVLMWRSKIGREHEEVSERDYWRRWLEERAEDQDLGRAVAGRIGELAQKLRSRNAELESLMHTYDQIREALREAGIDPDNVQRWRMNEYVEKLIGGELREIDRAAGSLVKGLASLRGMIARRGESDVG